jgi:hypothetical protein
MRILPYESAAVKVRVEAEALKLGHFLTIRCGRRGQACFSVRKLNRKRRFRGVNRYWLPF